jgi:hypothetical protein
VLCGVLLGDKKRWRCQSIPHEQAYRRLCLCDRIARGHPVRISRSCFGPKMVAGSLQAVKVTGQAAVCSRWLVGHGKRANSLAAS